MLISVFWLRAMVVSVSVKPPNAQGNLAGNPNPTAPTRSNRANSRQCRRLPSLRAWKQRWPIPRC